MLNLKYIFTKFDYFYYIFLFFLIFIVLGHLDIFNYNNIIPFMFSLGFIYLLINNYYHNEINKYFKNSKIFDRINYEKYPFLNIDESVILIVTRLENMFSENNFEYRKLLSSLNSFFSTYKKLRKNTNSQEYDNLVDYSKKTLNILNSVGVNIDFSKNKLNRLINIQNQLKLILSKYITEIEILINDKWLSNDVNTSDRPIYPDDINGLSYQNSNYNLY